MPRTDCIITDHDFRIKYDQEDITLKSVRQNNLNFDRFVLCAYLIVVFSVGSAFSGFENHKTIFGPATNLNSKVNLEEDAFYVSPLGDDTQPGTMQNPWRTLTRAASQLRAGDVLYVREGIYEGDIKFYQSGTADAPITITAYPGETPVIDGGNFLHPYTYWGVLLGITGAYNNVSGFEVRYSNYMGVLVTGAHSSVSNLNVHHNMENGIFLSGDYTLAENNVVWMNCLSNEHGALTRDSWASGVSAGRHPNFAIIRNNEVYQNYGEGLSTYEANGTLIEGNIVYDNWATNIYISDATNVILRNNYIYNSPDNIMQSGGRRGIMLGDERYQPPSSNITISDNLVYGTNINLYWWQGVRGGGLKDVLISNNTLINSRDDTNLQISGGSHQNVRIINNVIVQEDSLPVSVVIPSDGLILNHNLWSHAPNSFAFGTGDVIVDDLSWLIFAKWTGRGSKSWMDLAAELTDFRLEAQPSIMRSDLMPCGQFSSSNMSQVFCN